MFQCLPGCPDLPSRRTVFRKDGNQLKALSNIKPHVGKKTGIPLLRYRDERGSKLGIHNAIIVCTLFRF